MNCMVICLPSVQVDGVLCHQYARHRASLKEKSPIYTLDFTQVESVGGEVMVGEWQPQLR